MIDVLLVDDHAVVREGYRRLLESTGQIRVRGEAGDGEEAYRLFVAQRFDVVVMDITLPGASGLEIMRRMLARDAQARVLIFSMHEEAVFPARAMRLVAMGYVSKSSTPDVLVQAVCTVAQGGCYLADKIAETLARPVPVQDIRDALNAGSSRCCRCWPMGARWPKSPGHCICRTRPWQITRLTFTRNLEQTRQ